MATVTIPDILIEDAQFMKAFIEAYNEGKFLPGYWVNHLPNGTLENIRFGKDHNLVKATCYISYKNYAEATDAAKKILNYIQSSDRSIISHDMGINAYGGQERTLVYYTYNFMKI